MFIEKSKCIIGKQIVFTEEKIVYRARGGPLLPSAGANEVRP